MSDFTYPRERGLKNLCAARCSKRFVLPSAPNNHALVVTVLEPELQANVRLAANPDSRIFHATSLSDAYSATRQSTFGLFLISPTLVAVTEEERLKILLAHRAGFRTAGVVREQAPATEAGLSTLDSCGIRTVLDLSTKEDWKLLRSLVVEPFNTNANTIATHLRPALEVCSGDMRQLILRLLREAPTVRTVRAFSKRIGVSSDTLATRFFTARLPSVKSYLAAFRLLYATALLENRELSLARVSCLLEYSSPQSFSRHIKVALGISATDLREHYGFSGLLQNVIDGLFLRYRVELTLFMPYGTVRHEQRCRNALTKP